MNTQQAAEIKTRVAKLEEEVARLRVFLQVAVERHETRLEVLEGGKRDEDEPRRRPILTRPKLS